MNTARTQRGGSAAGRGRVLIAGGTNSNGDFLSRAELLDP